MGLIWDKEEKEEARCPEEMAHFLFLERRPLKRDEKGLQGAREIPLAGIIIILFLTKERINRLPLNTRRQEETRFTSKVSSSSR